MKTDPIKPDPVKPGVLVKPGSMKPSVLVINCGRNGYGIIRSLRETGDVASVFVADESRFTASFWSRHVTKSYLVPPATQDSFIDRVLEIGEELVALSGGKTVLVPTGDIYVILFQQHWERLSEYFLPAFVTDEEVLRKALDKDATFRLCMKEGVTAPHTVFNLDDLHDKETAPEYPLIIKPAVRNEPGAVRDEVFRLRICHTFEDVKRAVDELGGKHRYIIQEIIEGGDDELYTVGIAAFEGKVLSTFSGRKIRQFPPEFGQASYAESVWIEDTVRDTEKLVRALGYTGMAQFEFKHRNGKYYLLEINPRSWSWIYLAALSGANLPAATVLAVSGGAMSEDETAEKSVDGKTWSYGMYDLVYNVLTNRNIGFSGWAGQTVTSTGFAFFNFRDPLPAIIDFLRHGGLVLQKIKHRFIRKSSKNQ